MAAIKTPRLILTPLTVQGARLVAAGDYAGFGQLIGAQVPAEWPLDGFRVSMPARLAALEANPDRPRWGGIIIHQADRTVIGDIGCKGQLPDADGSVEIGYSIIPAYRRQGYAHEAAAALVAFVLQQPGVTRVTAQCYQENLGSIGVLRKVGMRQTGQRENLLQWEIRRVDPAS